MKPALLLIFLLAMVRVLPAQYFEDPAFHSVDSLAGRDEYGKLHQSPILNITDSADHHHWRWMYYLEGEREVMREPAYVGAVQRELRRYGYYCGEIDGVFSAETSDAVARMQKNSSMRVTGTLTIPVRRALHLP